MKIRFTTVNNSSRKIIMTKLNSEFALGGYTMLQRLLQVPKRPMIFLQIF